MEKTQLFFGTGNTKKIEEILQILGDSVELVTVNDLEVAPDIEETESTLEGNARLKAEGYYRFTGIPCFADDTGLEVDALNGAPGVYSARYAGEEGNAERNMGKLLDALKGEKNRTARFRTVIAYTDGEVVHYFEGILEGSIADWPSGEGGFGYDPIFIPKGSDKTLGHFAPEAKNAISHRGRAIRKFADFMLNG